MWSYKAADLKTVYRSTLHGECYVLCVLSIGDTDIQSSPDQLAYTQSGISAHAQEDGDDVRSF
jgi:hypothetical protein